MVTRMLTLVQPMLTMLTLSLEGAALMLTLMLMVTLMLMNIR